MAVGVIRRRIAAKGRLVIPKELREKAGLKEGDYVQLEYRNGEIVAVKEPTSAVAALRGLLKNVWPKQQSSVKVQQQVREEWRARERSRR